MSDKLNLKETALGIEIGSTRITAVLIGEDYTPIASGSHDWENELVDGVWTYDLASVWTGVQDAYQKLALEFESQYNEKLRLLSEQNQKLAALVNRAYGTQIQSAPDESQTNTGSQRPKLKKRTNALSDNYLGAERLKEIR